MRTRRSALAAHVVPVFEPWGRAVTGVGRVGARPTFGGVSAEVRVAGGAIAKVTYLQMGVDFWLPKESESEDLGM